MPQHNAMIDEIFRRFTVAPAGLQCSSGEVLTAAGLFISAVVDAGFKDQADRQTWIDYLCWNLRRCLNSEKQGAVRH